MYLIPSPASLQWTFGKWKHCDYINCNFILGSLTEVEQVWSMCLWLLTLAPAGIFPITLEAIIYLKFNQEWWDMAQETPNMSMEELGEMFEEIMALHDEADNDESYNEY